MMEQGVERRVGWILSLGQDDRCIMGLLPYGKETAQVLLVEEHEGPDGPRAIHEIR